jgi:epoxyqueuosine reductase
MLTSAGVAALARECGFDLAGVAPAAALPELARSDEWIARGLHGEMHYLARNADKRRDPRGVLPTARSVIVLGTLYNTDRPYSVTVPDSGVARISRYAWGDDYHAVIRARMDTLLARMRARQESGFDARPYVDTGPVQERVFAQRAGLGWVGKNTCLINLEQGSWFFLSVILCSLDLTPDLPGLDQCGTCSLCIEACPTEALSEPGVMDARRCISYLTIELKGDVPAGLRRSLGAHVFGCDICQEVCPFNQTPPVSQDPAWQPRPALDGLRLVDLAARSDDRLRADLRASPMKRAGLSRLRRNLAIAMENAGAPGPPLRR